MTRTTLTAPNPSSLLAKLNNVVDCFNYVQFSRNFDGDFEKCQLKLDIARLRLDRCCETITLDRGRHFVDESGHKSQEADEILELLQLRFKIALRTSKQHIRSNPGSGGTLQDKDLPEVARKLHHRLRDMAGQTQNREDAATKVMLTMYKDKDFDNLLDEITNLLADLEDELVPPTGARLRLPEQEAIDGMDEHSLRMLANAAAGTDQSLSEAAMKQLGILRGTTGETGLRMLADAAAGIDPLLFEALQGRHGRTPHRNHVGRIDRDATAEVQVGNTWAGSARSDPQQQQGRSEDGTVNSAGRIRARGQSRIQVGNKYGGSFFDRS
ncbi:hypothetical protein Purlil1_12968 [Purpureocillium lilacinum]|uniref:Fungal N-terminal domain-containing protein n=1 Tax=Purpureocillium lilacinum TaxID=33203 RepID=A0ABR0BG08_PURLI|nr:hypothetical protein Purlil1_12968 [Purpureocillium lilacinum]